MIQHHFFLGFFIAIFLHKNLPLVKTTPGFSPGGESWQPLGQTTPPAYEQAGSAGSARLVGTPF